MRLARDTSITLAQEVVYIDEVARDKSIRFRGAHVACACGCLGAGPHRGGARPLSTGAPPASARWSQYFKRVLLGHNCGPIRDKAARGRDFIGRLTLAAGGRAARSRPARWRRFAFCCAPSARRRPCRMVSRGPMAPVPVALLFASRRQPPSAQGQLMGIKSSRRRGRAASRSRKSMIYALFCAFFAAGLCFVRHARPPKQLAGAIISA